MSRVSYSLSKMASSRDLKMIEEFISKLTCGNDHLDISVDIDLSPTIKRFINKMHLEDVNKTVFYKYPHHEEYFKYNGTRDYDKVDDC